MAKRRTRSSDFVDWIERTIHLPLGLSAEPGQITLPIYLREIAAAMDDPAVEKITKRAQGLGSRRCCRA